MSRASADGPHRNRVAYRVLTCSCAFTSVHERTRHRCARTRAVAVVPSPGVVRTGPRDHAAASDALVPESLHLSARRDLAVAGHERHAERHRCRGDQPISALGDGEEILRSAHHVRGEVGRNVDLAAKQVVKPLLERARELDAAEVDQLPHRG